MRRSAEFATTVRRGRRGSSRAVMVHLDTRAAESAAGCAHVGFVVGRAVGPAVVRNQVRRRLRHLVRARLNTLPRGAALVVRAHPAAASMTFDQLAVELDGAVVKALR